ncbi:MAG: FAD-dependent oxidoreductase [Actinomycetota bacterium]
MAGRPETEVVVVGAGIMGSATAAALAREGREVVLVERFRVGHRRGSSHGAARIFRFSYPDPLYVGMMQEALPLWRRLEDETGETILTVTGGLDGGSGLEQNAAAMAARGVPFERIDGAEVTARFPALAAEPGEPFLFQAEGGIVAADVALRAFVSSAVDRGAELVEETRVVAVRPGDDAVEIDTEDGAYRARGAVVTAGAWARGLLTPAGVDLPVRPTRETVAYFRLDESLPVPTLVEWADPLGYALRNPGQGIKAAEHRVGPEIDPDEEGGPDQGSVARLRSWIRRRYPAADPEPHLVETCLYTNTEDESFVLERLGRLVVGSPCSGHGFKFAPLIGERLAALARAG